MGVRIMRKTGAKHHENPRKTPGFDRNMYAPESRKNSLYLLLSGRLRVVGRWSFAPIRPLFKSEQCRKTPFYAGEIPQNSVLCGENDSLTRQPTG